ncbi:hypothetical protein KA183_13010 [bacterium]|nr:hypothetical protein [bacterium]QQR57749.1 MAG: hypothetical protein IPG59_22720 [Candidatus Melainabacteria bacterium]
MPFSDTQKILSLILLVFLSSSPSAIAIESPQNVLQMLNSLKKKTLVEHKAVISVVEAAERCYGGPEFDPTIFQPVVDFADSQKLQTFELCRLKSKIAYAYFKRNEFSKAALQMESVINTPLGMNPNEMNGYRTDAIKYNSLAGNIDQAATLLTKFTNDPEFMRYSAMISQVPGRSCVAYFADAACDKNKFTTAEKGIKRHLNAITTIYADEKNYASLLNLILAKAYTKCERYNEAKRTIEFSLNLEDSTIGELSRKCWEDSPQPIALMLFDIADEFETLGDIRYAKLLLARYDSLQRKWQGAKNPQRIALLQRFAHLEGITKNSRQQSSMLQKSLQIAEWNFGRHSIKTTEIRTAYISLLRKNNNWIEATTVSFIRPDRQRNVGPNFPPPDTHVGRKYFYQDEEHSLNEDYYQDADYSGEGNLMTIVSMKRLVRFYTQYYNFFKLAELNLRMDAIGREICGRSYDRNNLPFELQDENVY